MSDTLHVSKDDLLATVQDLRNWITDSFTTQNALQACLQNYVQVSDLSTLDDRALMVASSHVEQYFSSIKLDIITLQGIRQNLVDAWNVAASVMHQHNWEASYERKSTEYSDASTPINYTDKHVVDAIDRRHTHDWGKYGTSAKNSNTTTDSLVEAALDRRHRHNFTVQEVYADPMYASYGKAVSQSYQDTYSTQSHDYTSANYEDTLYNKILSETIDKSHHHTWTHTDSLIPYDSAPEYYTDSYVVDAIIRRHTHQWEGFTDAHVVDAIKRRHSHTLIVYESYTDPMYLSYGRTVGSSYDYTSVYNQILSKTIDRAHHHSWETYKDKDVIKAIKHDQENPKSTDVKGAIHHTHTWETSYESTITKHVNNTQVTYPTESGSETTSAHHVHSITDKSILTLLAALKKTDEELQNQIDRHIEDYTRLKEQHEDDVQQIQLLLSILERASNMENMIPNSYFNAFSIDGEYFTRTVRLEPGQYILSFTGNISTELAQAHDDACVVARLQGGTTEITYPVSTVGITSTDKLETSIVMVSVGSPALYDIVISTNVASNVSPFFVQSASLFDVTELWDTWQSTKYADDTEYFIESVYQNWKANPDDVESNDSVIPPFDHYLKGIRTSLSASTTDVCKVKLNNRLFVENTITMKKNSASETTYPRGIKNVNVYRTTTSSTAGSEHNIEINLDNTLKKYTPYTLSFWARELQEGVSFDLTGFVSATLTQIYEDNVSAYSIGITETSKEYQYTITIKDQAPQYIQFKANDDITSIKIGDTAVTTVSNFTDDYESAYTAVLNKNTHVIKVTAAKPTTLKFYLHGMAFTSYMYCGRTGGATTASLGRSAVTDNIVDNVRYYSDGHTNYKIPVLSYGEWKYYAVTFTTTDKVDKVGLIPFRQYGNRSMEFCALKLEEGGRATRYTSEQGYLTVNGNLRSTYSIESASGEFEKVSALQADIDTANIDTANISNANITGGKINGKVILSGSAKKYQYIDFTKDVWAPEISKGYKLMGNESYLNFTVTNGEKSFLVEQFNYYALVAKVAPYPTDIYVSPPNWLRTINGIQFFYLQMPRLQDLIDVYGSDAYTVEYNIHVDMNVLMILGAEIGVIAAPEKTVSSSIASAFGTATDGGNVIFGRVDGETIIFPPGCSSYSMKSEMSLTGGGYMKLKAFMPLANNKNDGTLTNNGEHCWDVGSYKLIQSKLTYYITDKFTGVPAPGHDGITLPKNVTYNNISLIDPQ